MIVAGRQWRGRGEESPRPRVKIKDGKFIQDVGTVGRARKTTIDIKLVVMYTGRVKVARRRYTAGRGWSGPRTCGGVKDVNVVAVFLLLITSAFDLYIEVNISK